MAAVLHHLDFPDYAPKYAHTATYTYADASMPFGEGVFMPQLLPPADAIAEVVGEAGGAEAAGVSEPTMDAARRVLNLLSFCPAPSITIEDSGEISFEWYVDKHHLAVLSVDGTYLRWAGSVGFNGLVSGAEIFQNELPTEALDAVREIV